MQDTHITNEKNIKGLVVGGPLLVGGLGPDPLGPLKLAQVEMCSLAYSPLGVVVSPPSKYL